MRQVGHSPPLYCRSDLRAATRQAYCADHLHALRKHKCLIGLHLYIRCTFLFDGVTDYAQYNVKEKRFDKLQLKVAKSGITRALFRPGVVYADEFETVTIDIPEDLKPQERPKYKKVW